MIGPLLLIGLFAGGSAFGSIASARQDSEPIDVQANAEAIAKFALEPGLSGDVDLNVGSFTIAPGQSSMTLVVSATTVIAVRTGTLMIIADREINGTRPYGDGTAGTHLLEIDLDSASDGTGGAFGVFEDFPSTSRPHYFEIPSGSGAILRKGAYVRFGTRGAEPVQLLFISLTPDSAKPIQSRQSGP